MTTQVAFGPSVDRIRGRHEEVEIARLGHTQTSVWVFRSGGVTYVEDSGGVRALRHAHRSDTLADLPEEQGSSPLPVSPFALELWKEAVSGPTNCKSWEITRLRDLCVLAEVRAHRACASLDLP
jgi:hypothetical protein